MIPVGIQPKPKVRIFLEDYRREKKRKEKKNREWAMGKAVRPVVYLVVIGVFLSLSLSAAIDVSERRRETQTSSNHKDSALLVEEEKKTVCKW